MKRPNGYKRRRRGALLHVDRSNPKANLQAVVERAAERLGSLGVTHGWNERCWILCPELFSLTGKHTQSVSLNFSAPPALGSVPLTESWGDTARALFIEREREQHKSISSHRTFVKVFGYIMAAAKGRALEQLTPAILDEACRTIGQDCTENEAYKQQNLVSEIARRCSQHGLCRVDLTDYVFHGRSRPGSWGGMSGRKLDDPKIVEERPPRLLAESTFKVLGELFVNVPRDHNYRVYLLIITMLVCLGRRLSEVMLLPRQQLVEKPSGYYFKYLKLKGALGSQQYVLEVMPVLTEVVPLLKAVLLELEETSADLYACAEEMCLTNGPDLRFLSEIKQDQLLFYPQLLNMGLPEAIFSNSWFTKNNRIKRNGVFGRAHRIAYVLREDVEAYCWTHYQERMTRPLYIADGRPYYIKDMLILKWLGTSSGHYSRWIVDTCSAASFDKFILQLERLCLMFASGKLDQTFTSHDFRHTMNDALDRGGLPDVMQTEYFGRKNPVDTQAYQHTSPEKRALEIREQILLGQMGGKLAERAMRLPVDRRESFVTSQVRAVHDLGPTGMCFHNWSSGPCDRHLECDGDGGCDQLGWSVKPADPADIFKELMHQAAHNLIQLEIGFNIFPTSFDSVPTWENHLCIKISHLLDRASELVPGTGLTQLYEFVNTGGFDEQIIPKLRDGVGKGYELYKQCREKIYAQSVEYEREQWQDPERTPPYIPVKNL
jgi:integrase